MIPNSKAVPAVLALLSLPLATACSGKSSNAAGHPVVIDCPAPAGTEIAAAVGEYVKGIEPTPRRFVTEATGDSALPDAGREALQNAGPTYLFPSDKAQQETFLTQLKAKGTYPTLLVLYGGIRQVDKSQAIVHLSGRFVMGQDSTGQPPARAMYFDCRDGTWAFDKSSVESHS